MNIERQRPSTSLDRDDRASRRGFVHVVKAGALLGTLTSVLLASNPIAAQTGAGAVPPVMGQGPGYHDPRSAFKPLQEREGVLAWSLLSSVKVKVEGQKAIPQFPSGVQALHNQPVKIQGFMMPLEPGDKQRHFLLSSVPTSCSFCVPSGPEGLVEVKTRVPVKYTLEPVTVEGRLAVLPDDPYGLYYRIVEANPLP